MRVKHPVENAVITIRLPRYMEEKLRDWGKELDPMSLFTVIGDRIFIHLVKSTTVVNKLSSKLINANNNLQASILIFIQDSSKSMNNNVLMLSRKAGQFLESFLLPWKQR